MQPQQPVAGLELPNEPGLWDRLGRKIVVRDMLDDPGTWRLRGFDVVTGVEVEISEEYSPIKGGWRKAVPEGEGERRATEPDPTEDTLFGLSAHHQWHHQREADLKDENTRLKAELSKAQADSHLKDVASAIERASLESELSRLRAAPSEGSGEH